ncbi:hypothetical protein GS924_25030 [Rhodococcus hoagii]|nr:hypothetical protein [Prescottella equi]
MTARRAGELVELALLGAATHRPESSWFNAALQNQVSGSIAVMESLVEHARRREEAMRGHFTPEALELDLAALTVRFREVHTGFRKLSKAARTDKKALRAVTVTGKVDKDLIARLDEAASWHSRCGKWMPARTRTRLDWGPPTPASPPTSMHCARRLTMPVEQRNSPAWTSTPASWHTSSAGTACRIRRWS